MKEKLLPVMVIVQSEHDLDWVTRDWIYGLCFKTQEEMGAKILVTEIAPRFPIPTEEEQRRADATLAALQPVLDKLDKEERENLITCCLAAENAHTQLPEPLGSCEIEESEQPNLIKALEKLEHRVRDLEATICNLRLDEAANLSRR